MKQMELNQLIDMIDEIKKIDSMILLHQQFGGDDFMSSQYQSKKTRLVSQFIAKLVSPSLRSSQSFNIIQAILKKFYPYTQNKTLHQNKQFNQLLAAI